MRASSILGTIALLATFAAAGCGGPSDAEQASTTASNYFKSLGSANASSTCSLLTAAGKKQLATDANEFDGAYGCVEAARVAGEVYAAGITNDAQLRLEGANGKAAVSGTTAEVVYSARGNMPEQRIALVRGGDSWKVNKVTTVGADDTSRVTPDVLSSLSPAVAGKWRVVYSGDRTATEPSRTTWTIKACAEGGCGFKATSSYKKSKFKFRYDKAVGDFTSNDRRKSDCGDTVTGEILVKKAYNYLARWNVQPKKAILADGKLTGIEMEGTRDVTSSLTPAGEAEGCNDTSDEDTFETVRFVRINPPSGKEVTLAQTLEGEQGE